MATCSRPQEKLEETEVLLLSPIYTSGQNVVSGDPRRYRLLVVDLHVHEDMRSSKVKYYTPASLCLSPFFYVCALCSVFVCGGLNANSVWSL